MKFESISKLGTLLFHFEWFLWGHSVFPTGIAAVSNGNVWYSQHAYSLMECSQLNIPFGNTKHSQWEQYVFPMGTGSTQWNVPTFPLRHPYLYSFSLPEKKVCLLLHPVAYYMPWQRVGTGDGSTNFVFFFVTERLCKKLDTLMPCHTFQPYKIITVSGNC